MLYRLFFLILIFPAVALGQRLEKNVYTHTVAENGWGNNSVNTVIFRKNSLVSKGDTQFVAYYNAAKYMVLGKRHLKDSVWQLKQTPYKGKTTDAHNSISIMVDGASYLHASWDHHGNPLHYAKGKEPGSLELSEEIPMTGFAEKNVTYPEFYRVPDGNLLFLFREGASGQGNLVINQYDIATGNWTNLQKKLIDGEGERNAYWQACVDPKGTIHVSWVWRESPDVASNHDMCYTRSRDGGRSWEKTTGEKYVLPINAASAEYAWRIPQRSELINQTSMNTDAKGNPFIATYWRDQDSEIPQFRVLHHNGKQWKMNNTGFRDQPFSLSGAGTKSIPVSRPQILVKGERKPTVFLIFRDAASGSKPTVAIGKNLKKNQWETHLLSNEEVGAWEPSFDTERWKYNNTLYLFLQHAIQVDAEGTGNIPPQKIQVLEWKPSTK